ncbi:MAG: hypothetical protein GXO43_02450 [Crenarchaeota archaeon]|nr:hypothetical protein [Thermoproteota archaeon]
MNRKNKRININKIEKRIQKIEAEISRLEKIVVKLKNDILSLHKLLELLSDDKHDSDSYKIEKVKSDGMNECLQVLSLDYLYTQYKNDRAKIIEYLRSLKKQELIQICKCNNLPIRSNIPKKEILENIIKILHEKFLIEK